KHWSIGMVSRPRRGRPRQRTDITSTLRLFANLFVLASSSVWKTVLYPCNARSGVNFVLITARRTPHAQATDHFSSGLKRHRARESHHVMNSRELRSEGAGLGHLEEAARCI